MEPLFLLYYKLACLLIGAFVIYLGYRLFVKGIFNSAGDLEGTWKSSKLLLKKAVPGTYFVVLGTIIIGITIVKGFDAYGIIKEKIRPWRDTTKEIKMLPVDSLKLH